MEPISYDSADSQVVVNNCKSEISNFEEIFNKNLVEHDERNQGSKHKPWTENRITEVINIIKKAQTTMSCGKRRKPMEYYLMSKYDIMTIGNEDYLILKRNKTTKPMIRIVAREQYFNIISEVHKSCGHGGRDKVMTRIKNKYYIPKKAVEIFVSLCPICETKRNVPQKSIVLPRPVITHDFNTRGQVNLIDFQYCPDCEHNWLLIYQDNDTKFLNLRPLKTNGALEIATELMKIFLTFGAPYILQSDYGPEFTTNIIKELAAMWPDCKIVSGNPRRRQGTVDQTNQDVVNMLRTWMDENKCTNWSVGCFFVQHYKNASFHQIIRRSPYKALFGSEPKVGLNASDIPNYLLTNIETEEQLETLADLQF